MLYFLTVKTLSFQVKNENILLDSSDCQTKCPIRRQTIRSYPPGTALFVGDECVCDGAQETIYEYVPPVQPVGNAETPVGIKRKIIEPRSNNRVMGNYGSLVFSGNIQILNLLSIKNDNIYKGCCNRKPSNPSSDNLIMNEPIVGVNLPTTISGFKNVSDIKNKNNTTPSDVMKRTDNNVSLITEPAELQNSFTTVSELTSENIVTDESDSSHETERTPVTLTSLDIEIKTSTVNSKQEEDFKVLTTKDSMTSVQNNTRNESKSKKRSNSGDKDVLGMTINNSYLNKKPDLEILIINTNTINFNNQQRSV